METSQPNCAGNDPLSPSLDATIENLNNLILELDPTFQPISTCGKKSYLSSSNNTFLDRNSEEPPLDGHNPGILIYDEWDSRRVGSSQHNDSTPTNAELQPDLPALSIQTTALAHCSATHRMFNNPRCNILDAGQTHSVRSFPPRSPALSTSSNSQFCAMSPGNSHSLLSDDGDGGMIYRSAGSTYGSSGSFVNLQSPYFASPSSYKSSFSDQHLHQVSGHPEDYQSVPYSQRAAPGSTRARPSVPHGQTTYKIKKHSISCPPSAASSFSDIPVLLVNGSTQYLDQDSHKLKNQRLQSSSSSMVSLPLNTFSSVGFSKASSTTSLEELPCDAQPTVKFVQDTSKHWYKPNLNRDQAIRMLKDKKPGSFVVRESSTYIGSFGLAMKIPPSSLRNPDEVPEFSTDLIRHFLIEFSRKGVCLKGSPQEPYFGSLSALVYQHCISAMSLPCKLNLPKEGCLIDKGEESSPDSADSPSPLTKQRAGQCQRMLFFRRHYPATSVNHCGLDPLQRRWRKDNEPSRIFAFVAKNHGNSSENVCHLFAEFEQDHSAHFIINLVSKILLEAHKM
ncbi:hypothetical protein scyTo_0020264 [Scyliorhinus torazame]|uniref:SH2 domain-containing protein n=1 Tax=Scyliorhinus torazame TaxID=75743 RepID=A0A401PNY3_SCYTO|nr:hypothetical protein [Scyliorhinus torazame]